MKIFCGFHHFISILVFFCFFNQISYSQGIIIDHNCTDITVIPENAIIQVKEQLHIGYGHTSHGSQLTTGMTGLIDFINNGGLGISLQPDIFNWNNGGSNGALDLEDTSNSSWLDNDCGYYPGWVNETREYLNESTHANVNVIMWSWCGQVSGISEEDLIERYLAPMTQLEADYPNVTFVYMTGHSDGSGESGNLHLRNQQIRDYCIENDKFLFDFYDIECYDPDGNYFGDKNVNDNCNYDDGNWAIEWQNTHTQGMDWYQCGSAHSQPLNANRKAYAAWWLFARIAGWDPVITSNTEVYKSKFYLFQNYPNPIINTTNIQFGIAERIYVTLDILDAHGKQISLLEKRTFNPGEYIVPFNTMNLKQGTYFCRMMTNSGTEVRKIIVCE